MKASLFFHPIGVAQFLGTRGGTSVTCAFRRSKSPDLHLYLTHGRKYKICDQDIGRKLKVSSGVTLSGKKKIGTHHYSAGKPVILMEYFIS